MRFVIATLPDVHFNLGRDLALLKTCAIYGDETVLFSPNYAFTSNLLDFSRRPLIHQLLYLAGPSTVILALWSARNSPPRSAPRVLSRLRPAKPTFWLRRRLSASFFPELISRAK